jgi:hypothetical protein
VLFDKFDRVGGIFKNADELTKELLSDEFRRGDAARPVGEGKYAIVKHQNHTELVYILELPMSQEKLRRS